MTSLKTALFAALTAATALTGTLAQADLQRPDDSSTLYYAQIDCHGSGLDHTDTNSNVRVKFVSTNGDNAGTARKSLTDIEAKVMSINPSFNPFTSALGTSESPLCNAVTDAVYMSNTFEPFSLKHIVISTGGDDAFWMDEVRVYRRDFNDGGIDDTLVAHFGRDNGKGWCLSTDANDINGSFKTKSSQSGCIDAFRFRIADEKVFRAN